MKKASLDMDNPQGIKLGLIYSKFYRLIVTFITF
jgi:hypothetical protein